jgi:hypothetical protein
MYSIGGLVGSRAGADDFVGGEKREHRALEDEFDYNVSFTI